MITLTTPPTVTSVLGGTSTVAYNRMVLTPIVFDPRQQRVTGTVRLTVSGDANMTPIEGLFSINVATSTLEITVERLDFYRRVLLTSPQNTAVLSIIANAQNALEQGLIDLGLVAGTQAPGAGV